MSALRNLILFAIYIVLMTFSVIGIPFLAAHLFYMIGWDKKRAEEAEKKLSDSLMEGESAVELTYEMRPYALFSRRSVIAITNSRIVFLKRPLFGGFKMIDIQWKDVTDAELSQNIFPAIAGSKISITHSLNKDNIVCHIPSDPAFKIYKYAQKEEQAWEEKRRVRSIEETRAAAGGTYITSSGTSEPLHTKETSAFDEIKKAKALFDEGVITDAEFNELKSKILNQGRSI